ncbi:MAG: sigma-70 family RNA polymerase sigma factor [Gemmataceae bacterium]|nr:sigma-70 family RNA polymerase sigma factor [Gemmataceae bacterium]MDW8265933.1 sigma-70 family RNA polymerase sigma factor [Gemmataceae bacterium]
MGNKPNKPSDSRQGAIAVVVLATALSALGLVGSDAVPADAIRDIGRYCSVCWRNARLRPECWADCTQEVFVRLLERVGLRGWDRVLNTDGEVHREFLRAIDAVKKRSQRARPWASLPTDAVADRQSAAEQRLAEDREAFWRLADRCLTPRQHRIIRLLADGWRVQEIAAQLRLPVERVSDEKYKAIQKLRASATV